MVSYVINMQGSDHEGIAQEVMMSAIRILAAVGFSDTEIASLFAQASAQLGSDADGIGSHFESLDEDDDCETAISRLAEEFENIGPMKDLKRLAKRSNAFDDISDPATLVKAVKIIIDALELRKQSFRWLRDQALSADIAFVLDHNEWIENATDDELDQEDQIIFLDGYQWNDDFNWHLASQVIRELTQAGDREHLEAFCSLMSHEDALMEPQVRSDIRRALGEAGEFDRFSEYVQSHAGMGEQQQSEFLDRYVRISDYSDGTGMLDNWLDGMSRNGRLERYKRANRWRVIVH